MFPPCEMMVKDFLPAMRGLLAHNLRARGLSQPKIASLLGVTQSAVSQLLSKPPSLYRKKIAEMGLGREELDLLLRLLLQDIPSDPVRANLTLYSFWRGALSRGVFCQYHRRLHPQLSLCEICLRREEVPEGERLIVLRRIEEAVRMIEGARYFVNVMPEVAVNIAEAPKDAKTVEDVAAIPGRIVRLKDKPKAVSKPEYGGSRHLARVLLAVKRYAPEVSAVINLKLDEAVESAIKSLGLRYSETRCEEPYGREREEEVIEAVAREFGKRSDLDVVIDRGGMGLEPTTYIFAENAEKAAEKALKIARRYVEEKSSANRTKK